MGLDNQKAMEQLRNLEQQVDSADDLAALKPIFFRLEEIAKENVHDFDVQLKVGDIKQHLVNRGAKIKQSKETQARETRSKEFKPAPPPPPPAMAAPPYPPIPAPPPPPMAAPPAAEPLPPSPPPPTPVSSPLDTVPPPAPSPPPPLDTVEPASPPMGGATRLWAPTETFPAPGAGSPHAASIEPPPQEPPVREAPPARVPPPPVSSAPVSFAPVPPAPLPPANLKPAPAAPKPPAKPPVKPAAKTSGPPPNWQRAALIGAAIGLIVVVAIAAGVTAYKRRQRQRAATAAIQVQIATNPPGASIRVNGDAQCTSNCSLNLAPGNYQITAFLDGYEPAASGIAVAPGQPVSVNLTLDPQAQSLRIITDLDQGKVAIDGQEPEDLQQGQFVLDRVLPGSHTVKVTGKSGEATFSFEIADAKQPVITGPVTAKNLEAVLVASLANQAHVLTSGAPMKLVVNGQPEADTSSAGVDLKNFQAGVDELVLGEGKDQHSVKENFGPAPMLTAFLKSDLNAGTLIVSTGEDDVRVFLNNKEYPRHTQRGQLRIQTLGNLSVRVMKDGFESPPPQTAEVKKGAETRLEFKLKAVPRFATLQVNGGTPGAEVVVDQQSAGTIGADGSLTDATVPPGDHTVEIRLSGYGTRRLTRSFRAGQTVTISGSDAALTANPPPPVQVTKKELPPPPKQEAAPPPPPAPKAGSMADWQDPSAWKMEGGIWTHRGGGFIPYALPPKGIFTFTVELVKGGGIFHGGHVRWCLDYVDNKNFALFEMDNKNFWAKVVSQGKTFERTHTQLKDLEKQKSFTIQIDVTPEHIVHKMFTGGDWINLDSWAETGRNFSQGKFGFLIQGKDEIGLSDFKFQPK